MPSEKVQIAGLPGKWPWPIRQEERSSGRTCRQALQLATQLWGASPGLFLFLSNQSVDIYLDLQANLVTERHGRDNKADIWEDAI